MKKNTTKNLKMGAYKFKWEPIPNTVRTRMIDGSFLHTVKRKSRVKKQTKLLNMRSREGEKIRSCQQYLKLKKRIMKECPNSSAETDDDTSDESNVTISQNYKKLEKLHYLRTPSDDIFKNGTHSLSRKRKLSVSEEHNDTDDDSDGYSEPMNTRSKKNARSSKETYKLESSDEDKEDTIPNVKQEKDENENQNDSTTMNIIETYSEFENNNTETNNEHLRIQLSELKTEIPENTSNNENLQSNHERAIFNDILPTSGIQEENKHLIQTALYNLGSNCEILKTIKIENRHESKNCNEAVGKENVENSNEDTVPSNGYLSKKNKKSGKIMNPNLVEGSSRSKYKKTYHPGLEEGVTNKQSYDSEELCTELQNSTQQEMWSIKNEDGTISNSQDSEKVSSSTSTATQRVSNLAEYVATQNLKLDMRKGSIKLKHISPDEEIWIMEVPKKINPEDLIQQTLVLDGKTRLEVQDTCYKISAKRNKKDIHLSCMFNTGKRKHRFKTVNFKPEGFIKFREKIPDTCEPEVVLLPTPPVQFPKNLKKRHPLLGSTYKNNNQST